MGPRLQTKDEWMTELIIKLSSDDKLRLKEIQKQSKCMIAKMGFIYTLVGGYKLGQIAERLLNQIYSYEKTRIGGDWYYIFQDVKDVNAYHILLDKI